MILIFVSDQLLVRLQQSAASSIKLALAGKTCRHRFQPSDLPRLQLDVLFSNLDQPPRVHHLLVDLANRLVSLFQLTSESLDLQFIVGWIDPYEQVPLMDVTPGTTLLGLEDDLSRQLRRDLDLTKGDDGAVDSQVKRTPGLG